MKPTRLQQSSEKPSIDSNLDRYFSALKDLDYQNSFQSIHKWLGQLNESETNLRTLKQKIFQMVNYFSTHRVRFAVLSVVIVVGFIACTMPIEQEETFGYMLSGEINKSHEDAMKSIKALQWVDPSQLSFAIHEHKNDRGSVDEINKFAIVMPDAKRSEVESWKTDLETLTGVQSVMLQPLEETVRQPVYKSALKNIFKVKWVKIPEEQVEHIVKKYLDEIHMEEVKVRHITKLNGDRILELSGPVSSFKIKENGHLDKLNNKIIPSSEGSHMVREYILREEKSKPVEELHEKK